MRNMWRGITRVWTDEWIESAKGGGQRYYANRIIGTLQIFWKVIIHSRKFLKDYFAFDSVYVDKTLIFLKNKLYRCIIYFQGR